MERPGERPRLYILDAHGYVFRAHYGLLNTSRGERQAVRLSTAGGMPTGALYVFARMLMALRNEVKPERMAVVFDSGRKNFRSEIYPEYKANRSTAPEELTIQMPFFRPLVDAFRWPVLAIEGVEADDVIATLVCRARERGWEVVVYSADKDMMQLVGEGVQVIDAMRQHTFTRAAVIEKFGVPPEQIADFLALVGDTSDNIPGVEGIGKVTAAKLLTEHGTLDAILAAAPAMKGKLKERFTDPVQIERLRLSRRLVELDREVKLPMELDALTVRPWDKEKLAQLFAELEFFAMIDKVQEGPRELAGEPPASPADAEVGEITETSEAPEVPGTTEDHDVPLADPEVIISAPRIAHWVAQAREARRIGLVLELDGDRPDRAQVIGLGVAVPGTGSAYVPLGHRFIGAPPPPERAALQPLWDLLADADVAKVCHDYKTATRTLGELGHSLVGVVDDPMLAAFLLDPTKDAQAAEVVAALAAGVPLAPRAEVIGKGARHKHSVEMVDVETAARWVGRVAEASHRGASALRRRLARSGLEALYRDIEMPVARILADLERTGVTIDVDHFRTLSTEVSRQIAELERKVFEIAGSEVNLGSPKQLASLLFDRLGLESDKMKKTKTGYSTDHEVLESLVDAHPIVAPILEHREIVKLKGTYLDALPPLIQPRTGRVHTTFNQVVAATGRISSQDPNLQNIPIRSELGRAIRRGFIASPGKRLLAADYSQIELRILAHLSGDPVLVKAFRERVDVHTETAAEVFAVPRDQVSDLQRRIAKAVNYGLAYGQSDFGLSRALDIPRKEAKEYSDRYFERFPTIRRFMENVVAEARARGGARTVLGRWRPIPDLASKSPMARRAAERVAQNTPMQGTGADLIKLAMIRTTDRIARDGFDAAMILTVHDELVFEVAEADAERLGAAVKEEMEQVYALAVPLDVDIGIAMNWADA
jgi:DNA polymerase-1